MALMCVWVQTHRTKIQKLVLMRADRSIASRPLCLGQKAARERTAKTTAGNQLFGMCSACMRGNNSLYYQVAEVCIYHWKKGKLEDSGSRIYKVLL